MNGRLVSDVRAESARYEQENSATPVIRNCMATSPTQLSLAWLKKEGYLAEVVEKWIPGANIRKDLWGWTDIVAIRDGETVAVQCTSWDNISSRVRKIEESDTVGPVRKANWSIWVIGWKKKDNRWTHKLVDIS